MPCASPRDPIREPCAPFICGSSAARIFTDGVGNGVTASGERSLAVAQLEAVCSRAAKRFECAHRLGRRHCRRGRRLDCGAHLSR
jgi:hypothetical protein